MRRIAVVVTVVVVALVALLGVRLWVQARARNAPPGGSGEIEGTTVDVSARITARVLEARGREGTPGEGRRRARRARLLRPGRGAGRVRGAPRRRPGPGARPPARTSTPPGAARTRRRAAEAAARAQAAALAAQRDVARREATRLESLPEDVSASTRDRARGSADQLAAPDRRRRGPGAGQRASRPRSPPRPSRPPGPRPPGARPRSVRPRRRRAAAGCSPTSACCAPPATPCSTTCPTRWASWWRPGSRWPGSWTSRR